MLNEILSWWLRQMLGLVPLRWRRGDSGPANAIVLAWNGSGDGAELLTRRDHKEASLGRFALDEAGLRQARALLGNRRAPATVLRLPTGLLLERQVTLPLAAEQGLDRVVRFEMDRFTPFAADEVYFAASVRRRDRAQGRLTVAISLVPRVRLVGVLAALAQLRLAATELEAPPVGGGFGAEPRRIPLGAVNRKGERWQRGALWAMGAACAVLAVVAAGLPFWLQAQARDAVEARIADLKPRVDQADALRRRMSASAAGNDVIGAEHARVGDALHAMATLTDILANDTYLLGLTMQKRQVTLEGQSAAAAKLLTTLSGDPTVRNAAFAAPVTRSETGNDLFSIKAEIAP
jgi:general secretion pathway protein L